MNKLKTKDTLKKLLEKYQVYLHYMEMEAYFEKEKDAQINPDEITVARIIHYKADVLFSLVMEIVFHSTIHFDTFSAFFDFSFIESSLIKFSMDERFQIFEALLKTYIEQLKIMSEKDFTLSYQAKDLDIVLDNAQDYDRKSAIEEYKERKEKLPLLESLFSKKGFSFQEAHDYLTDLKVNEHFAHFFLEFLQEKYQKKKRHAVKFTKYYFDDNKDFIYYVSYDKNMANYLDNLYLNFYGDVTFNEKESTQLHYEFFRLLEGKEGENYLGYYQVIYSEMNYVKENEIGIFSFLLKALCNDITYITQRKDSDKYDIYQKLKEVLEQNFSLEYSFTPNKDEVRASLLDINFPIEYVDSFIDRLVILYHNRMPKAQNVIKKDVKVEPIISKDFLKMQKEQQKMEDNYKKQIESYLESLCNEEEKELLLQAKNALLESNSSFKGYQELLRNNLQNLLDIAREMMENQADYEFYMDLFIEEMSSLKENLEQFQLIADYIPKRVPNKL